MSVPKVVFIAGGGTGGHIYPGVAIAKAIQKRDSEISVRFVGTRIGLEGKIIPKEGFPLDFIHGGKLNFSGIGNKKFIQKLYEQSLTLLKAVIGFFQSMFLIYKYRPICALGVGGYASGPFVLAAAFLGVPTAIWEPNVYPGMANRWLSHIVNRSYVVFSSSKKWLKNKNIFLFGMPVRKEIEEGCLQKKHNGKFHLLSFGGSQGSQVISTVLSDAIVKNRKWAQGLEVVHQTGSIEFENLKTKYRDFEEIVRVYDFIYDMHNHYAWADLVVSRGGAGTISELAAFGIVPIIIPLPAADNHQQKNAESLVQAGAGRMILQSELTPERLIQEIEELRTQPEVLLEMSKRIKSLFQPMAAEKMAENILNWVLKS